MSNISASQVTLFHEITGYPVMESKLYLQKLPFVQRMRVLKALQIAAETGSCILYDPLEDEPRLQDIFESVRLQASREAQNWYYRKITESEYSSSEVTGLIGGGRDLCHKQWSAMKRILRDRYGLEWMTPAEMNPCILFG